MAEKKLHYTKKLLPEIVVTFRSNIPPDKRLRITSSRDAERAFRKIISPDTLEYKEQMYVLCLGRNNAIIGYFLHSIGGLSGTIVDTKQILGIAVKTNTASIILCHNHPSGNTSPSRADRSITSKIVKGASLLDITMLDHLILTRDSYYSFADEGTLPAGDAYDTQKVQEYVSSSYG